MSGEKILLSFCIPTYKNASNLQKVIEHILDIERSCFEVIICDDAPDESDTRCVIEGLNDKRLHYFENDRNLGYEKNLFRTIERADGKYVMPLADEDKVVEDNIHFVLDLIETSDKDFSNIIAGYGPIPDDDFNSRWDKSVPAMEEFERGYDSLKAFVDHIPHQFADHTWKRNYIGGIVLKRGAIDLDVASDYIGSLYIHNVLILQAMMSGNTVLSSRHLCLVDYYQYEGDHRFWSNYESSSLKLRMRLQKYRMKAISEILKDDRSKSLYTHIEIRFAAKLAAWATLQKGTSLEEVRRVAFSSEIRPLDDIWNSREFKKLYLYYLAILPLPTNILKKNVRNGLIPRSSVRVCYHLAARLIPESIDHRIRIWYGNNF